MQKEIWKTIEENENYEVSNMGNVRRKEYTAVHKNGVKRIYKSKVCKLIDYRTCVAVSIKGKSVSVARLVANAFLNPKDKRGIVYHKNGNIFDNKAENLSYSNETILFDKDEDLQEKEYLSKYYHISNEGTVIRKCDGKILKSVSTPKGYMYIRLKSPKFSKNKDRRKNYKIHRLVAMFYLDNYSESLQVNHKNGIKSDNRAENLEMVTNSENALHAWRELDSTNRRRILSENNRKDKVKFRKMIAASIKSNSKKVSMINCSGDVINTFDSMTAAAKFIGTTSVSGISYAAKHKTKRHGYFWKFI